MATPDRKIDRPLAMPREARSLERFAEDPLPPSLERLYTQMESVLQTQSRTAQKLDRLIEFMHENARTGARVGKLEETAQRHANELTELRTKAAIWGAAVSMLLVFVNTAVSIVVVSFVA